MTRPLVSVLLPAYNAERWIGQAIDSIWDQRYRPIEVIVVDDGSNDATAWVARDHDARVVSLPHAGIAVARNAGVDAARGDIVAWLDADDVFTPGGLDVRIERLLDEPELDFVMGFMEIFVEPGSQRPSWLPGGWLSAPQQGLLTTLASRREVFDTVGRFDASFPKGEDTDFMARLKDSPCKGVRIDDVCARYRLHGQNTTFQRRDDVAPLLLRAIRNSVARQREAIAE